MHLTENKLRAPGQSLLKNLDFLNYQIKQSFWLSKWRESATGETVSVRGIVVLPGWYGKRPSANGIPVANPKEFPSLFTCIRTRELSEETRKGIVHQLEQKCRDVEPASKITEQD